MNNLKPKLSSIKPKALNSNKLKIIVTSIFILLSIIFFNLNPIVSASELGDEIVNSSEIDGTPKTLADEDPSNGTGNNDQPTTDNGNSTTATGNGTNTNGAEPTDSPPVNTGKPYILIGEKSVITGNIGEVVNLSLPLVNLGTGPAVGLTATLGLASEDDLFPFEIEKSEYIQYISGNFNSVEHPITSIGQIKSSTVELPFGKFKIRENLNSGYYRVTFKISYRSADSNEYEQIERYFFIKVINPEQGTNGIVKPGTDPGNSFDPGFLSDAGGYSPGIDLADEIKSTPRLLITGFSTNPEKIFGGTEFTIKLKIKNTSKDIAVKNIKLTLSSMEESSPIFMPVTGASTIYIEKFDKNSEQEVEVKLKSNATIEQKAYPLELKFEYEDTKGNPFTAEEVVSIMVFQELRFDLGKMQIMPNSIEVGSEANVMFNVFNKGKATLYNLSIILPKDGVIEDNEIFVGNLESGNSKDVDFMAKAIQENPTDPIPFKISFEDAEGKVTTIDKELNLIITEAGSTEFPDPFGPGMEAFPGEEEPAEQSGFPWWGWLLIGLGGIIVITVIVKIMKSHKAKKEQAEIDEMV